MVKESDVDEAKGRVKEAAGDLTNDQDMKREGKADQASSQVKEKVEQAKEAASDMVDKAKDAVTGDDKK